MSYGSILRAVICFVILLSVIVIRYWPRDLDGKLMSVQDLAKWMENRGMREPPKTDGQMFYTGVFILIAMLALALH